MLSFRWSVLRAPSLRRLPRNAFPSATRMRFSSPLSQSPPLAHLLQSEVRLFSKKPKSQRDFPKGTPEELQEAEAHVAEFRASGKWNLTQIEAGNVLYTLASHKRLDESVELLQFTQTQKESSFTPYALKTLFHELHRSKRLIDALQVFHMIFDQGVDISPSVYGKALNAATILKKNTKVGDIVNVLLSKAVSGPITDICRVAVENDGVEGVIRSVREQGVNLPESVLRALVVFAIRSKRDDLALEMLQLMLIEGVELTSKDFDPILIDCGRNNQLDNLVNVYNAMPEEMRSQLTGNALGSVMKAHGQSGDEEVMKRGLEIFQSHQAKWNLLSCNIALEFLLRIREFTEVFTLADEMKDHGLKWSSITFNSVALAYINSGSREQAKQLLYENAEQNRKNPVWCFRDLIDFYATKVHGTPLQTCQLSIDLIRDGWRLTFSDCCDVLSRALKVTDLKMYWQLRQELRVPLKYLERDLPENLVLPEEDRHTATSDEYWGLPEVAEERFDTKRKTTSSFTPNDASRLLAAMATHDHADKCAELLDLFDGEGVYLLSHLLGYLGLMPFSDNRSSLRHWRSLKLFA